MQTSLRNHLRQGATAREAIAITSNTGSTTLTYANDADTTSETYTVELWSAETGGTKLDEFTATILGDGLTYSVAVDDTNLSELMKTQQRLPLPQTMQMGLTTTSMRC